MNVVDFLKRCVLYGSRHGWFDSLPDTLYLKWIYRIRMGKSLNLDDPFTFNEKIQWLKVNNRSNIYSIMVDKFLVRDYVKKKIGEEYLIPLLKVWESVEDINLSVLPSQFVLKTTHDSGGVVICRDKANFDLQMAINKLSRSIKHDYYGESREWPYKNVKPRIIAEQYMQNEGDDELHDYKFYCFNGIPKYCHVIGSRSKDETMDFFDMDWNRMPFTKMKTETEAYPHDASLTHPPISFDEMKKIASTLSKGQPFIRIDLYQINGKVFFGEITFFPNSGFGKFFPEEWDMILGQQINLQSGRMK